MWRIINSAFYVAPSFLASIIIVSIISNSIGEDFRVNFFLFLSVFYPFAAIAGQTRAIQTLNDRAIKTGVKLDIIVLLSSISFIFLYIGNDIDIYELLLLGLSVTMSYRASTELVKTQINKVHWLSNFLPLITSICRVVLCWFFVSKGFAVSFFISSLAFYLIPKAFNTLWTTNNLDITKQNLSNSAKAHSTKMISLCLISFVISSTFFFQWDRYILQSKELVTLISDAGVYSIWALSPTGLIFSIVYRSESSKIFKQSFDWQTYRYIVKRFLILTLIYVVAAFVIWDVVNAILFPFFSGSVWAGLLLIFAVITDRIGSLYVLMSAQAKHYLVLSLSKFSLITISIFYFSFYAVDITLSKVYFWYLCVSIVSYFIGMILVSTKKTPS